MAKNDPGDQDPRIHQVSHGPNSPNIVGDRNQIINVAVNQNRRMSNAAATLMIDGLKANPCKITLGVLGMGGEPDELASQIFQIVKRAIPQANGVNHGIGFEPFSGIQLRYSPINTPMAAVEVVARAFTADHIDYFAGPDPNQPEGSVYIFVGYKL
jgi:hypothetical protein